MNRNDAIKQFVQMFISGAVSTAIAIINARRFETWWAGLIGVPIALLLCDVRKSVTAIKFTCNAIKKSTTTGISTSSLWNHLKLDSLTYPEWLRSMFEGIYLFTVFFFAPSILINYVQTVFGWQVEQPVLLRIAFIGSMAFSGTGAYRAVIDLGNKYDFSSMVMFPISRYVKETFKMSSSYQKPETEDGILVDKNGNYFSSVGIWNVLKDAMGIIYIANLSIVCNILWPLLLIDALLTIFLKIITNKGIALAIGVIIGFSTDYYMRPQYISLPISILWLVSCSTLGGVLGWTIWMVKEKLSYSYIPSTKIRAVAH